MTNANDEKKFFNSDIDKFSYFIVIANKNYTFIPCVPNLYTSQSMGIPQGASEIPQGASQSTWNNEKTH